METSKGRALRLEVAEPDKRVWFRLYSHDAAEVRGELDPGAIVYIRARVSEYLRKGGFLEDAEYSDLRGNDREVKREIRRLDDKFSLEAGSLELFYVRGDSDDFPSVMTPAERLRSVALFGVVSLALDRLRAGLDSRGSGIEEYHEAEEILSTLLGNPIWVRPE